MPATTQAEIPPGGYAVFQEQVINDLNSEYSLGATSVHCALPSTWVPGKQFNCDIFSGTIELGILAFIVEPPNPNTGTDWNFGQFTQLWSPNASGA